ncbi:MAG: type II toxin-antitoxin system Phd/YefM family antitoxin [Candidatus Electrothrix sp.]
MDIFTYSEARQKLSTVLDRAQNTGKVLIRRKDGRTYSLVPEKNTSSPLDVSSIKARVSTEEIIDIVRSGREREDTAA